MLAWRSSRQPLHDSLLEYVNKMYHPYWQNPGHEWWDQQANAWEVPLGAPDRGAWWTWLFTSSATHNGQHGTRGGCSYRSASAQMIPLALLNECANLQAIKAQFLFPNKIISGFSSGKSAGYRYFGAAKQLPGVKELFEREAPKVVRKTRFQMHKAIDPDYYGFRDEEDGVLVKVEEEAEKNMRAEVRGHEWRSWRDIILLTLNVSILMDINDIFLNIGHPGVGGTRAQTAESSGVCSWWETASRGGWSRGAICIICGPAG